MKADTRLIELWGVSCLWVAFPLVKYVPIFLINLSTFINHNSSTVVSSLELNVSDLTKILMYATVCTLGTIVIPVMILHPFL